MIKRLPSTIDGLVDAIDRWVRSPDLAVLVSRFGGRPPIHEDLASLLDWLEEFSQRWDYRSGKERNLVVAPDLDSDTKGLVLRAADNLGLVGPLPISGGHYDHILVLGGLVRACFARPLHAAKLLEERTVTTESVAALGGFRELAGDELELVSRFVAEPLKDEFEAMDAGVRSAFRVTAPTSERGISSDLVGGSWHVREYTTPTSVALNVVAAPSSEPGARRANTADTYRWFATELARLSAGQRLLLVTSDIYAPYQHADALRMFALPYGVEVETAGIRPGDIDRRLAQEFLPHHYLQEIRSTVRAFRALLESL